MAPTGLRVITRRRDPVQTIKRIFPHLPIPFSFRSDDMLREGRSLAVLVLARAHPLRRRRSPKMRSIKTFEMARDSLFYALSTGATLNAIRTRAAHATCSTFNHRQMTNASIRVAPPFPTQHFFVHQTTIDSASLDHAEFISGVYTSAVFDARSKSATHDGVGDTRSSRDVPGGDGKRRAILFHFI